MVKQKNQGKEGQGPWKARKPKMTKSDSKVTPRGRRRLSGPIRANRFACESRIFSANPFSLRNNLLFANRPSKKWDSSEDWSDWTRITRTSMRIGEKTRFVRIWPSASKIGIFLRVDSRESIRANLRNVGVRIACPLRVGPKVT